jgi:hypothetical protein
MTTNRLLLVMTFMGMFLFGTSLFGQQEVDPTWYSPWSDQDKVAAQPAHTDVAKDLNSLKIVSGLSQSQLARLRGGESLVGRPSQNRRQPLRSATSEAVDFGMPSKGYFPSVLVVDVQR